MCKKACSEAIIAAVRSLRHTDITLKPNTASGKRLRCIFKKMRRFNENDVHAAFESLLRSGAIVIVAHVQEVALSANGESRRQTGKAARINVKELPAASLLAKRSWFLDSEGRPAKPGEVEGVRQFFGMMVYVTADGLPEKIKKVVASPTIAPAPSLLAVA